MIFSDLASSTPFGVAEGVGIVLLGIGVGCMSFCYGSGCRAFIAGPDLIPIITAQECGRAVQAYLGEQQQAQVVPTTLVAMVIGNVVVGGLFLGLGSAKKTATAIGFVPASVISGFLSSPARLEPTGPNHRLTTWEDHSSCATPPLPPPPVALP